MKNFIKCNIKGNYEGIWKLNHASKRLFTSEVQYVNKESKKVLRLDNLKYIRYLRDGFIEEIGNESIIITKEVLENGGK